MENQQIAILGAGSMGGAILSGLIRANYRPKDIRVSTKTDASAKGLVELYGVEAFSRESNPNANSDAARDADLVLVAVKPNYVLEVLREVTNDLKSNSLVVSVAAGVTTSAMEKVVEDSVSVIRAMPNTPSIVGLGVTGISVGSRVKSEDIKLARELFETVGQVLEVDESKINALSTISGSGPAYVFYFAEKLAEAAKKLGFSEAEAELMVEQTFVGAAELMRSSDLKPVELRQQVTSPNGTTMQAVARFDQANLEKIFIEATEAALARAIELGSLNS
jgi:pyrroline-5-carboxylate reductase